MITITNLCSFESAVSFPGDLFSVKDFRFSNENHNKKYESSFVIWHTFYNVSTIIILDAAEPVPGRRKKFCRPLPITIYYFSRFLYPIYLYVHPIKMTLTEYKTILSYMVAYGKNVITMANYHFSEIHLTVHIFEHI